MGVVKYCGCNHSARDVYNLPKERPHVIFGTGIHGSTNLASFFLLFFPQHFQTSQTSTIAVFVIFLKSAARPWHKDIIKDIEC